MSVYTPHGEPGCVASVTTVMARTRLERSARRAAGGSFAEAGVSQLAAELGIMPAARFAFPVPGALTGANPVETAAVPHTRPGRTAAISLDARRSLASGRPKRAGPVGGHDDRRAGEGAL